jgi:hypothetical protein
MVQNNECYAKALNNRSSRISGEHYVSRSLLKEIAENEIIFVKNHGLDMDIRAKTNKPIRHRINNKKSKAKILCTKHNSDLSRLDKEGSKLFKAIRWIRNEPEIMQPCLEIEGDLIERLLLKTYIGGVFSGALMTSENVTSKGKLPDQNQLEIVFGAKNFAPPCGLRIQLGESAMSGSLEVGPSLGNDGKTILGFLMKPRGVSFFLQIEPNYIIRTPKTMFRPTKIIGELGRAITIKWINESEDRECQVSWT